MPKAVYCCYYNVDCYYFVCSLKSSKFHLDWLLAIAMYGLRLFIVVLQVYRIVFTYLYGQSKTSLRFVALHFPVSEIAKCIA